MKILINVIVFILFLLFSCDHGLDPETPEQDGPNPIIKTGLSGTIFYQNWPSPDSLSVQDSLYRLKLVVFKDYPPGDIVSQVTSGEAVAYPSDLDENLPFYEDSTEFLIEIEPGIYKYISVAQQYGPFLFLNWRSVGQYDTTINDTIPTSVEVFTDSLIKGINIYVDFDSLPGQPF